MCVQIPDVVRTVFKKNVEAKLNGLRFSLLDDPQSEGGAEQDATPRVLELPTPHKWVTSTTLLWARSTAEGLYGNITSSFVTETQNLFVSGPANDKSYFDALRAVSAAASTTMQPRSTGAYVLICVS